MKFAALSVTLRSYNPETVMLRLSLFKTPILVDMLAANVDLYSKLVNEGASQEEFAKCSLTIKALQTEIESRKNTPTNNSSTEQDVLLSE